MAYGCNCRVIRWWNPAAKVEHTPACPDNRRERLATRIARLRKALGFDG